MTYQLKHKTIGFGFCPQTKQPTQGIDGKFFIPAYQRGYRWKPIDVKRLLDDILESNGESYSLQPIVVKPQGCSVNNEWELIDGQQRLTTLWLILNYMEKGGWKKYGASYSLEYETRQGSLIYLTTLDAAQAKANIDYFHLYQAHTTINNWFTEKATNDQAQERLINQIHGYLSDSVRVIWYETPDDVEPIPLFTRLNRGRIALTDAELIKAVLLSAVKEAAPGREIEVAAQWDGIERDLQRPEIWAFVAGQQGNANADAQYATRISLLLDTLAKKCETKNSHSYFTFDSLRKQVEPEKGEPKEKCLAFWEKVVALHAQILGWFEEPRWYNKIGFLVASSNNERTFGEILTLSQEKNKDAFEQALKEEIKISLGVNADDLRKLEYGKNNDKLLKLLLLLNVETCKERFPFVRHVEEKWSLEHIHAQNAESLTRAEQWKTWMEEHKKALNVVLGDDDAKLLNSKIDKFLNKVQRQIDGKTVDGLGDEFTRLSVQVQNALSKDGEPDHSIANLALLSHNNNSAISNAVFEVKRQKILELDRAGGYIPTCTRNVFLKYYAGADAVQPHFWSDADKKSYLAEITDKLKQYFKA